VQNNEQSENLRDKNKGDAGKVRAGWVTWVEQIDGKKYMVQNW